LSANFHSHAFLTPIGNTLLSEKLEVSYLKPFTNIVYDNFLKPTDYLLCALNLKILSVLLHVSHRLIAPIVWVSFLSTSLIALLLHLVQPLYGSWRRFSQPTSNKLFTAYPSIFWTAETS